jgi:hypothetical protein
MNDMNPYAAPQSDLPYEALADKSCSVWRDGDLLVMREKGRAAQPVHQVQCAACTAAEAEFGLRRANPIVRSQQSAERAHRQD